MRNVIFPPNSLKYTFLAIILLSCTSAGAQFGASAPSVNPVTPNSAALFKSTERPVGAFTGTTPISIPLYTISAGPLQVPVSLNYDNGGIKVEELASSVGLGFNLSAGGRITRVLRGLPDESPNGFLNNNPLEQFPHFYGANAYTAIGAAVRNDIDVEPDLFYIDCNGISGKFYFGHNGQPHMVEQANLKIEAMLGYESFIVTDEKGTKYYFGTGDNFMGLPSPIVDRTSISYISNGSTYYPPLLNDFISTWHLVEIVDLAEQNRIFFDYAGRYLNYLSTLSSAYLRIGAGIGEDCTTQELISSGQESMVTSANYEYALVGIEGSNSKVQFNISLDRQDFAGHKIDAIVLKDKNDNIISRHHFNYDYFISPGISFPGAKRLKLKNISQFGKVGNDSIAHKFEYVESTLLPARNSRDIDYWGYYNGPNNNWTFLPKGIYKSGTFNLFYNNLGERRANPNYSQSNTLRKITYPTGGHREFIYEGNTALREEVSHVYPDRSYILNRNFEATDFDFNNPFGIIAEKAFTIDSDYGNTEFSFYFDDGFNGNSSGFAIKIYRVNGTSEVEIPYYGSQFSNKMILNNGNYKIKLTFQNFIGYPNQLQGIYGNWEELSMTTDWLSRYGGKFLKANMNVGGIRVKEVRDYDPVADKVYTTKYSYTLPSDPTLTSGLLISPVSILSIGGACLSSSTSIGLRDCSYMKLATSSDYPLASEGGSYVVYPEVRTYEEGNGYIDREYSFSFDGDPATAGYLPTAPIVPPRDNSRFRNKLVTERFYSNAGDLLKQTSSGWHNPFLINGGFADMYHTQIGWKTAGYWDCSDYSTPPDAGVCHGCCEQYQTVSGYNPLAYTINTTYASGSNNELKTEYDYYAARKQPLIKQERVFLNDNKIRYTDYRYAFQDKSEFQYTLSAHEDQIKTSLNSTHYTEPLEVVTYIKKGTETIFVEGKKLLFDTFNGKLHLAKIRSFFADGSSVDLIMNYDANGNLTEKFRQHDVKEVYLWGYNGEYPVAKIIGTDIVTVNGIVSQSQIDAALSDDVQLRNLLNNLRTNLQNAQVWTYTYAPLFGMTSATDPKGLIIYYEYDAFGRLMHTKDNDGNILKKHEYKYVAQ